MDELPVNEVCLDELPGVFLKMEQRKHVGRTIVKIS